MQVSAFRGCLIALALCFLSGSPALSKQVGWHPPEKLHEQSQDANEKQTPPEPDKRGTLESPLVVKTVLPEKNPDEAADDARERDDKRFYDRATIGISFFTLLILCIQARVFYVQADRLKQTIDTMERLGTKQSGDMQASIVVSRASADAARDSAAVAREALIATQRAFVFIDVINPKRVVNTLTNATIHWVFEVIWKNSGNTPTKDMFVRMNLAPFDGDLPLDFDFADLATDNNKVFIGPQSRASSSWIGVEIDDVEAVIAKTKKLFLWGWAEYNDVFAGTKRHRIEYCFDIQILGEARTDKNTIQANMHARHNGQSDI